jgi:hypothetical protein
VNTKLTHTLTSLWSLMDNSNSNSNSNNNNSNNEQTGLKKPRLSNATLYSIACILHDITNNPIGNYTTGFAVV